jgi:hypothetical protein
LDDNLKRGRAAAFALRRDARSIEECQAIVANLNPFTLVAYIVYSDSRG